MIGLGCPIYITDVVFQFFLLAGFVHVHGGVCACMWVHVEAGDEPGVVLQQLSTLTFETKMELAT